jgi:hypothetical protein
MRLDMIDHMRTWRLHVLENLTLGAIVMAMFSAFIWGGAAVAVLMSRISCIGG